MPYILLVDDLPARVAAMTHELASDDIHIIACDSIARCLATLDMHDIQDFHCILIHNQLNHTSGIKICTSMKKHNIAKHVPIIIICDVHNPNTVQQAVSAGALDLIPLPLSYDLLRLRLRNISGIVNAQNERHKSDRLLQEAKATERMASIGIMARGIAHEFNNLNTIILGNIELLLRKNTFTAGVNKRVRTIHDAVLRSKQATGSLLNFTRGNSETDSNNIVTMQKVLTHTLEMAHGSLAQHRIHVRCDMPENPVLVLGNEDELNQVFLNLVINAMHAMKDQKNKELALTMTVNAEDEEVSVCIQDTGCGISHDTLQTIFRPYAHPDSDTDNDKQASAPFMGSALGLSISETIIEHHCGSIHAQSTLNSGSLFTVALPTCTSSHFYIAPQTYTDTAISLSGKHILIADDEAHIRNVLHELFEEHGCIIHSARNGTQALHHLHTQRMDIILLDWQMPILDGAGFLDQLALLASEHHAPVLVMSGWHVGTLLTDAHKRYAPMSITKPFKSADIIEAAKETLATDQRRASPS